MPAVSVIIPTYNRANLIGRAIRSVLNQTYQDLELLVIDDGSTDGTDDVVRGFADPRIHYLRRDSNGGASAARNTGIRRAKGRYMAFLDSDDEWLPEKLERQIPLFQDSPHHPGVTYTACYWVDQAGTVTVERPTVRGDIFLQLAMRAFLAWPSIIIKREVLAEVGLFDESLPLAEDRDLLIRLAKNTSFDGLDDPLAWIYQDHKGPLEDRAAFLADRRPFYEKLSADPDVPRSIKAYHFRRLSRFTIAERQYGNALSLALTSLRFTPVDARPYLLMMRLFASWMKASAVPGWLARRPSGGVFSWLKAQIDRVEGLDRPPPIP